MQVQILKGILPGYRIHPESTRFDAYEVRRSVVLYSKLAWRGEFVR